LSSREPRWRKALPKTEPGRGHVRLYVKWGTKDDEAEVVHDLIDVPQEIAIGILARVRAEMAHREQATVFVSANSTKIIHALHHGISLCRMSGMPVDWPEGHFWVRLDELDKVTCAACLEAAKESKKSLTKERDIK